MNMRPYSLIFSTQLRAMSTHTQFGQTKMDFNGPQYKTIRGSGLNGEMVKERKFLDFTPNTIWDMPGARRIPKRVGRGQGSGKG